MTWLLVVFLDLQRPPCTPLRDPFGGSRTCRELRDPFKTHDELKIPDLSVDPEDRIKTNALRIPKELR